MIKQSRTLKMVFNKNSDGYVTPRAVLPKSIINDMGINQEEREFSLQYNPKNKTLVIKKTEVSSDEN